MATSAVNFYQTTIGKKVVMAISGIIGFGFLLGHMAGNLLVFVSPEAMNEYSATLHANPVLLWGARFVLVAAIGLHVLSAVQLLAINSNARPRSYYERKDLATNYAALTMKYGGLILLLFIAYHLAHLTYGKTTHIGYVFDPENVYNNVVLGFMHKPVAFFYIAAQVALGMHLYHGLWSLFQTLGANHPRYNDLRNVFAATFTVVIVCGFVSIPVSVLTGSLQPTDDAVLIDDADVTEAAELPGHALQVGE